MSKPPETCFAGSCSSIRRNRILGSSAGNAEALRLARDFGFQPLRKLMRMARRGVAGADEFVRDDSLVFAITGFEYG